MEASKFQIQGFSLIELMFAIAIIAAIAVMGLAAYKQRVINQKVDQAVLQLQTILQGAMAYYVANNDTWPTAKTFNTMLTDYVGIADPEHFYSPFYGKYSVVDNQNHNNYFTVATTINTHAIESKLAGKVADLISGRLPIARADENSHTVYASVPIPAQTSGNNRQEKVIYNIRVIQSGTLVKKPKCPAGRTPELDVATNDFVSINNNGVTRIIRQVVACNDKAVTTGDRPNDFLNCDPTSSAPTGYWKPTIDLLANGGAQLGTEISDMKLLAITSCKLTSTQNKENGSLDKPKFVF